MYGFPTQKRRTKVSSLNNNLSIEGQHKNKGKKDVKMQEVEESKNIDDLKYTEYFEEYFPIKKSDIPSSGLKHKYRVSIHRAMITPESFEIYKKYQKSIHHEDEEKNRSGYGRFLCWSPLFDPRDESGTIDKP